MSFHNSFKLNDVSFNNEEALLLYCKTFSEPVYVFLKEWFNTDDFITVKTSGSTGKPKLIHLKKEYMKNSAVATGAFFNLNENESTYIPDGVKHRLENDTDELLEIIEVQSGEYLEEDDIVRFEDDFGRLD